MSNDDPSTSLDHDGRCRKLVDISGTQTTVELLEFGPLTDQAMLRYQVEYADAFAFVFSLYSAKTLETAQKLHDKVEMAARNHHNIVTMSEYERTGMSVPVFLIGNRDGDLAPPQGELILNSTRSSSLKHGIVSPHHHLPYHKLISIPRSRRRRLLPHSIQRECRSGNEGPEGASQGPGAAVGVCLL